MNKINDIPVEEQDTGLYEGPVRILLENIEDPVLNWKGAKITKELWRQIVAFMAATYEAFSSEAQLRLYYNEELSAWRVAVFPQYIGTGMFSEEIKDHKDREEVFESVPSESGWKECGTVHHHCSYSAFQSGTDHKDEIEKNGFHITLGDLDNNKKYSFHSRVSFRGIMYESVPLQWLDYEKEEEISAAATKEEEYPEAWDEYLHEKPKTVARTVASSGHIQYGAYGHSGHGGYFHGQGTGLGFGSMDCGDLNEYYDQLDRSIPQSGERTNLSKGIGSTTNGAMDVDAFDLFMSLAKAMNIEPDSKMVFSFINFVVKICSILKEVESATRGYKLDSKQILAFVAKAVAAKMSPEVSEDLWLLRRSSDYIESRLEEMEDEEKKGATGKKAKVTSSIKKS